MQQHIVVNYLRLKSFNIDIRKDSNRLKTVVQCTSVFYNHSLTLFFPMFPFDTSKSIEKPKIL